MSVPVSSKLSFFYEILHIMLYRGMILYAVTNIILWNVDRLYTDGMKLIFNGYY